MTSAEPLFREATAKDLSALLPLYRQLTGSRGDFFNLDQAEKIFLRLGNYPDYAIYVAEHRRRIVATFALLVMDSLGHMGVPAAVLEDVVVAEQHRGTGIGRRMMSFAAALARQKGCSKLFFCSGLERTDTHRFYENLGFRQHGYSYHLNL